MAGANIAKVEPFPSVAGLVDGRLFIVWIREDGQDVEDAEPFKAIMANT